MIADFERSEFTLAPCVWPATFEQDLVPISLPTLTTSSNTTTISATPSASPKKVSIGPIIGGVVGGLGVLLAALILVYFFVWKPRQKKKKSQPSEHSGDELMDHKPPTPTSTAYAGNNAELDSKHIVGEMLDSEVERLRKYEVPGTPGNRGEELDTHVPVGSELWAPQVFEMQAREPVGSEMASPVNSQRSPSNTVSPLSQGGATSPGYSDREGGRHQTYYNP
jgi:hypothetical protein